MSRSPAMDSSQKPSGPDSAYTPTEEELEEMMRLLEAYEHSSRGFGDVPLELKDMMNMVKRAKGQRTDETQTEDITPEPGFVIKTTKDDGHKVFINMCHSNNVPAPGGWTNGMIPDKVLKALDDLGHDNPDADAAEALRFPLSCSEVQADSDKQGQPCSTIDCIVHSDILAAAQHNRHLKAFLVELAIEWVGSKHKLKLSQKFKLPKMAYKGEQVRTQRVRIDRKPLVTDVTAQQLEAQEPSFALRASKPASKAAKQVPGASAAAGAGKQTYEAAGASALAASPSSSGNGCSGSSSWQYDVTCEGKPVSSIVVKIQLPTAAAAAAVNSSKPGSSGGGSAGASCCITAEVSGKQLRVSVPQPGTAQQCVVQLPFAVSAAGAEAVLQQGTGQLEVRLPYLPVQDWVQQIRADAPLAFKELPLTSHASYMELE